MRSTPLPAANENDPLEATLVFHEQADGRKVARLPGGKVVLLNLNSLDRVRDGEAWFVKLSHRDTFSVADPVERVTRATLESSSLTTPLAEALARAKAVTSRRDLLPTPQSGVALRTTPAPVPPGDATGGASRAPLDLSRILRGTDRVALFVDGANTDGAARAAGYFLDFRKARDFMTRDARSYAAFYYVADFSTSDPLQQRFFDFLSHSGFIVRRRPVKVIRDEETGERIIKGNLDTEIVLDLMNTAENYDVAFLFSGDSDFERAVELLRSRGKRVYVVSAKRQLSRELAYVADKPIIYLEDHREILARSDRPSAEPG